MNKIYRTICVKIFCMTCLLLSSFSYSPLTAAAQTPTQIPNGCGPDGFAALVPNSTILSSCQFKKACNTHDVCYAKCLKGGALFGNSTCKNSSAKKKRRRSCDLSLRNDITKNNPGKFICRLYATAFHWAVSRFGDKHFYGAESMSDPRVAEMSRLMKYIEKHPNSFDLHELDRALEKLQTSNRTSISFEAFGPTLVIYQYEANGKRKRIEIKGKSPQ